MTVGRPTRRIDTLLIANRGEIAVRIARTAHALGMATVGVYSEPDAAALHVRRVDRGVALGGSSPADSYLRIDAVLEAAHRTGADAIHPGYGFLAENAEFAEAVIGAGLAWVGPTPEQIRLLGDKVAAKRAALAAGVPTTRVIEVSDGGVPDGVTFPALVKAAAGGGGRGMRVVDDADALADALAAASREAAAAFGDGTVFIEPYIERGRHIEVQILGDTHGNVVHLGERECSIQRRNQKVIEESPSAGISGEVRTRLWDGALALARHVGYEGAGTVEFMVAADGTITFLEVNTRLQVEHPVTEAITGLDLVELQLRVAQGEPLGLTQDDVRFDGHAIEARVVAEDPAAGWLPSTGILRDFSVDGPGVRVDTGFEAGSVVPAEYDSLLAKVIAHGSDRDTAARRLGRALRSGEISGVRTNASMLVATLAESDFGDANTPTSYLDAHPEVCAAQLPPGIVQELLVGAVIAHERTVREADDQTGFAPSGWRNLRTIGQRSRWRWESDEYAVEFERTSADSVRLLLGEWPAPTDDGSLSADDRVAVSARELHRDDLDGTVIEIDGVAVTLDATVEVDVVTVRGERGFARFELMPRFTVHAADEGGGGPICPLPGTVIAVHVSDGDHVAEGALLMVVEAMKMEHRITAAAAGVVDDVRFAVGDRVDTGDLLVAFHADE